MQSDLPQNPQTSEPALFAPSALIILIGFMLGLHAYRALVLGLFEDADIRLLDLSAFVPARFTVAIGWTDLAAVQNDVAAAAAPAGPLRRYLFDVFVADGDANHWTAVSYAFLHASWEHVIFNSLWTLAFGAPVMQRFGTIRFFAFFAATAAFAAVFHAVFNPTDVAVLVGASGAVSGLTAAALRFTVGPYGFSVGPETWTRPAAPLSVAMRDKRVMVFMAVWFGINLLAGLGIPLGGADARIAWEAHVGGFIAGLLLYPLFDPIKASAAR
jgi:membrane associated rhomboid family serine protease